MDRRVLVISGLKEQEKQAVKTLNDLSTYPQVVLLGEPGSGKTTALNFMANQEGASVVTVRALINGSPTNPEKALFLDALDEYRSDGSKKDKLDTLAQLIHKKSSNPWRLTCRAEDWRNQADTQPLKKIKKSETQEIVVVQLLPLDGKEACAVLSHFGEENPENFMDKAKALGAHAFTQNPLSLQLLHKAVSNDDKSESKWPATRFALFTTAIKKLAYEHNPAYQADRKRNSPEHIIEAAGQIALLQLLSGTRAIWRSNGPPPDDADPRAFIALDEHQLEQKLLCHSLDTPLFRGTGKSFEFMHRTIAEFLAGKRLARAVTANGEQARIPLRRALAWVIGNERKPPTELRGVFAWFAAHLAQQGDAEGAKQMVEIDAFSLLAYGDAAAFNTETRRALLRNLDRDDPYFRATEQGITVLGGWIDAALTKDIVKILQNPPEEPHLLVTVTESLLSAQPIPELQPHFKKFVLDPSHQGWQRKRVLEAFIHGSTNRIFDLRELFDALASEAASISREELRIKIAVELYPLHFPVADLQRLLVDFEQTPEDNTVGRLFLLEKALAKSPCPALFEFPSSTWRSSTSKYRQSEVDRLLDSALAGCIRADEALTGEKLWQWVANARQYIRDNHDPDGEIKAAVCEWLQACRLRESELFEAILSSLNAETGIHGAEQIYLDLSGNPPSENTLQTLYGKVKSGNAPNIAPALLAIFVEKARQEQPEAALFWEIYERLQQSPDKPYADLLLRLTTNDTTFARPASFRNQEVSAPQQSKQAKKIEKLTALIPYLHEGENIQTLSRTARLFFKSASLYSQPLELQGMERVIADSNQEIAEAISVGWEYWATKGLRELDIPKFDSAYNSIYYAEYAAVAGLALIIKKQAQANIPESAIPLLTLAVLRCYSHIDDSPNRTLLGDWVASQLAKQPEQGVEWLSSFWRAALKMTDPTLSGMDALSRQPSASAVLSVTLTRLLTEHDNLSASTLLTMLLAADKVLNKEQMAELCATALGRQSISKDVRLLWQLLQFLNSPTTHPPPLIEAIDDKQVSFVLNILGQFEHPSSDEPAENKRVIARFIIDLAGPLSTPSRDGSQNLRRKVCKAINQLSSDLDTEAVTLLQSLIENPKLRAWQANLRHALSDQTRLRCDQNFIYPSLSSLHEALAGPAPVNAADLFAIAIEELRRLQRELHTVNTTPWKRYWNSDRYGEATEPLIENECRNHLLERLKDRFTPYKISAVPEAQSREERRVDILLLAGGEGNLPIEAKRHFHQEVWLAASSQLQEYATAAGADGYGIFLVFWFGSDYKPTPALPDNSTKPNSAELMEAMLIAGLPEKLRRFTEIIVFDVSNKGGNKNK